MYLKKDTQILFHWVNLVFQFGVEVDAKPFLKHETFKKQQRRVGIGAFGACADRLMAH